MNKILTILVVLMLISTSVSGGVISRTKDTANKIVETEWLRQQALKWGMVTSLCASQALNGAVDGYHYRQAPTYLINAGNYHAFATAQRASGIVAGWFTYATTRSENLTGWGVVRRFLGSSMLARNAFEWSYKGVRYGDPFDYSKAHNRHSLVYFKISADGVFDAYIGTGPVTGPLVDVAFLIGGLLILK